MQMSQKLFQEIEGFTTHSMRPVPTKYQSQKNKTNKQKLQSDISHDYRCKNSKQNVRKLNQTTHKNNYMPWPSKTYFKNVR